MVVYYLRNRRIEVELAVGVVLLFERLELLLVRGIESVPALRALSAISIVDVRVELTASGTLKDDVPQLLTQLLDSSILRGTVGRVNDERCSEHEL
jgi:hypothetical protein